MSEKFNDSLEKERIISENISLIIEDKSLSYYEKLALLNRIAESLESEIEYLELKQ